MKIKNPHITLAESAAVGTWAIVFGICLYWLPNTSPDIRADAPYIVGLFILYIVCFMAVVRKSWYSDSIWICRSLYCLQLLSAFLIMWLYPVDFLPILTIIWVSMLPHFMSLKKSLLVMFAVVVTWFWLYSFLWQEKNVIFQALLYSTFHFFAVLMNYQTQIAEEASEEAMRLNKELQATQHLLAEASRQNERTRIARDLHDLLGHHLTALIINLQVANHLSEGKAKDKIEQCHSLAKLLLSDVREAVSTLRENQSLDFHHMVDLLIANTPKLTIHSKIDSRFNLEDLNLAKTLLSCIQEALTNSLRHSGAQNFWLSLVSDTRQLALTMHDDGAALRQFDLGNGLKGMQERVAEFSGQFELQKQDKALKIAISIPLKDALNSDKTEA